MVQILWRCVALLYPVRAHLAGLCAGFAALGLLLVPPSLLFLDLVWTRALEGHPLPALQAWLLRLDPALAVNVPALSEAVRRQVLLRAVAGGLGIAAAATPLFFGLWYWQIWVLQRINQLLRVQLLERLQLLSLRFHSESRVGDALYRLRRTARW